MGSKGCVQQVDGIFSCSPIHVIDTFQVLYFGADCAYSYYSI